MAKTQGRYQKPKNPKTQLGFWVLSWVFGFLTNAKALFHHLGLCSFDHFIVFSHAQCFKFCNLDFSLTNLIRFKKFQINVFYSKSPRKFILKIFGLTTSLLLHPAGTRTSKPAAQSRAWQRGDGTAGCVNSSVRQGWQKPWVVIKNPKTQLGFWVFDN